MKPTSLNEQINEAKRHLEHLEATAELEKIRSDPLADPVIAALPFIHLAMAATKDVGKLASLKTASDALFSALSVEPNSPVAKAVLNSGSRIGDSAPVPDVDSVRHFLTENPGKRSEEIAAALSTTTAAIQKVLKPLMEIGEVRKEGDRRSTQYFLREVADRPPELQQ